MERTIELQALEAKADMAYQRGDYVEAVSSYESLRACSAGPLRDSELYQYGVSLKETNRLDEAMQIFEEVKGDAEQSFYDSYAALQIAIILAKQGKIDEAKTKIAETREKHGSVVEACCRKPEFLGLEALVE